MAITVLKPIRIDVKQDTYIYPHKVKQNDTLTLNFSVWDDNVSADLSNYICLLKVNKSNGKGYEIRDATISGNNVSINCPSSITQFSGELLLELCFIDSANSLQKSSFNIIIEIQPSVLATNDKGDLPQCVITAAEELDKNLKDVEATVQKAETANRTLTNTVNNANTVNSNLNSSISTGNTLENNLDNSIAIGKQTIEELKKTNSQYTDHINNWDIHLTEDEKKKVLTVINNWDTILEILNSLSGTSYLVDENGDYLVDENGDKMLI